MGKNAAFAVVFLVAAIVTVGMIAFINTSGSARSSSVAAPAVDVGARQGEWIRGGALSALELVEYSDFQCPACAANEPRLRKLFEKYGNRIKFVYRHFPLRQHANAVPAAAASEAAGKQGKFWEMHDLIFSRQTDWAYSEDGARIFESYAEELGLNMDLYMSDVVSDDTAAKIKQDYEGGIMSRVDATPTFFLNGKRVADPYDAIEKALGK